MDDIYRARLSATPHGDQLSSDNHAHHHTTHNAPNPPPQPIPITIKLDHDPQFNIQPFPNPNPNPNPHPNPPNLTTHTQATPLPSISVQVPDIYLNPAPARPANSSTHVRSSSAARHSTPTAPATIRIGPWKVAKPHPLLWVSLILSLLAVIMEVPKGTFPTFTGRHKALRAKEKTVAEQIRLINHFSQLLPAPLAALVHPDQKESVHKWFTTQNDYRSTHYVTDLSTLRFWSAGQTMHTGGDLRDVTERWWSVEELGDGASLVRSKTQGGDKEIWVIGAGGKSDSNADEELTRRSLLSALTHSLLLRDRLQQDLNDAQAGQSNKYVGTRVVDTLPQATTTMSISDGRNAGRRAVDDAERRTLEVERQGIEAKKIAIREEWDKLESRRARDKAREVEIDEREREVGKREQWVVEEMRKMSEKMHLQASELTLEDRITERLKMYQRRIAELEHDSPPAQGVPLSSK